jgi:Na+/H+ antiporter NhaD/arsenite permease-like protein
MGIAQRAGNPVSFGEFTRKGAVVTATSLVISIAYLWVRYSLLA